MRVSLEDEIVRCGTRIGIVFACGRVPEKVYKNIVDNAVDITLKMGFGPMLAYILYEAGENRISKNVAVKVVESFLEFKDKTKNTDRNIVLEIFKIANMTYKILRNKKHLCRELIEEIDFEKVISLIT